MKWMILSGDANKSAAQKYDEMEAFFIGTYRGRFNPHATKTARYAPAASDRKTHPDGRLAFPVIAELEDDVPNAPHKFPTPMTEDELRADSADWFPRSEVEERLNPTAVAAASPTFLQRNKRRIATGAAAAAAAGAALGYFLS